MNQTKELTEALAEKPQNLTDRQRLLIRQYTQRITSGPPESIGDDRPR